MKSPAYLLSRRDKIYKAGEALVIKNGSKKTTYPTNTVAYIIKVGNTVLTEPVLDLLSDNNCIVHRFSYGFKYKGCFLPPKSNLYKIEEQQYKVYFDKQLRLRFVKDLLFEAYENKLSLLESYQQRKKEVDIKSKVKFISDMLIKLKEADNLDSIRGYEGICANAYLQTFSKLLKRYEFNKRVYNPPDNEVNCLLSYLYSLLYCELSYHIHSCSLTVYCGYLHEQNNNNLTLVYDISEIFKFECDRLILKLINKNMVQDSHFNKKQGICMLNVYGKKLVTEEWEKYLCETSYDELLERHKSNRERYKEKVLVLRAKIENLSKQD